MFQTRVSVRYDDLDESGKLSALRMLTYLQNISIQHSNSIGHSLDVLKKMHRCWIVLSWDFEIHHLPEMDETVTVQTDPIGFGSVYGYRNFKIFSESGTLLGEAHSVWVLFDTERMRPARVLPDMIAAYGLAPATSIPTKREKEPQVPPDAAAFPPFSVLKRDIDTNSHVNNVRFAEMAAEFLPPQFVWRKLRAYYKHAAYLGNTIYPKYWVDNGVHVVSLQNEAGETYAALSFAE